MGSSLSSASPAIQDVICDRHAVLIRDPKLLDVRFRHITIGHVASKRVLGNSVILYRCVLPAGDEVLVPAGYVSEIPPGGVVTILEPVRIQ